MLVAVVPIYNENGICCCSANLGRHFDRGGCPAVPELLFLLCVQKMLWQAQEEGRQKGFEGCCGPQERTAAGQLLQRKGQSFVSSSACPALCFAVALCRLQISLFLCVVVWFWCGFAPLFSGLSRSAD